MSQNTGPTIYSRPIDEWAVLTYRSEQTRVRYNKFCGQGTRAPHNTTTQVYQRTEVYRNYRLVRSITLWQYEDVTNHTSIGWVLSGHSLWEKYMWSVWSGRSRLMQGKRCVWRNSAFCFQIEVAKGFRSQHWVIYWLCRMRFCRILGWMGHIRKRRGHRSIQYLRHCWQSRLNVLM